MLSIILPTYNRAHLLPMAIKSVREQFISDWELIVVDDGSTDNTKEVVDAFHDARIKYLYQENAERSTARNSGIKHASGDWICFLDSDDEYSPEHLSTIAEFIEKENPAPGLISTGLFISNGKELKKKDFLNLQKNILVEIGEKFLIPTQVCVHRSILDKEKFDGRFRLWEDTHLWLRIASQYPVYQIEKYTAIQNIHDAGTVVEGMKQISIAAVDQYVIAIKDLRDHYSSIFMDKLPKGYFDQYIDSKYKMYLYQSRQNKQLKIATRVFFKAFYHQPSLYLLKEFFKIPLNFANIGIHEKVS